MPPDMHLLLPASVFLDRINLFTAGGLMAYGIWQSAMYTEGCGFDSRVDLCCLSSIVTNWLEYCFNSEFSCMSHIPVSYAR